MTNETKTTNAVAVKIPVKLVEKTLWLDSSGHYAPITVLINGKEYKGNVSFGNINLTGLDVASIKSLGFELDYTEVLDAYNKAAEIKEKQKLEALKEKRAKEWEERNELAKSINFNIRETKDEYILNGHSWGLDLKYTETYKGKTIIVDISEGYSTYSSITNNIFSNENRVKKFKSYKKLPEYVEEVINLCKGAIDYDVKKTNDEDSEFIKVQNILGKDVTWCLEKEVKEHYVPKSYGRPARFYTTRSYLVKGLNRSVNFNPVIKDGNIEAWSIGGLRGNYTTDELNVIIGIVRK